LIAKGAVGEFGSGRAAFLATGAFLAVPTLPELGLRFLRTVVALADVLLLFGSAIVLLWFIYRIYLRRVLRARRIANLRMKRLLEERDGEGEE
jgi:hypothetical protein